MIILNERKYAEKCIQEKNVNGKPFYSLSIIAKYYFNLGYNKKQIEELLLSFIKISYPDYIYKKRAWENMLSKISNNAINSTLFEIEGVWITKSELEKIEKINNSFLEKISFAFLCYAKFFNAKNCNNNNWVKTDIKEIFKTARVTCPVQNRYLKLSELNDMKLLEFPKRNGNMSNRVPFVDDTSEKVLFVSDFRELGYEYLKYKGENIIRCQKCGILVRKKVNNQIYCSRCGKYELQNSKTVICEDCGEKFEIDIRNNKSTKCKKCYSKYRKKYIANKSLNFYYDNKKNT